MPIQLMTARIMRGTAEVYWQESGEPCQIRTDGMVVQVAPETLENLYECLKFVYERGSES